jgi:AcrR family transcriptional regulator
MATATRQGATTTRGVARGAITRDHVVDVALGLVQAEGVDALTMRRLARELGVAVTAIYWHVGDKQALLDALAERIAAQVGEVEGVGDDPVTRIVSIGTALRQNLLDLPELVGLVHQQGHTAELFQPVRVALARELLAAGVDGDGAELAIHVILSHTSGSVLNDVQIARAPAQQEALSETIDRDELFDYSLTVLTSALIDR